MADTAENTPQLHPPEPDWATWEPQVEATLMFLVQEDADSEKVLLIEKLTGFGAGKVNGPGGKLEDGETPLQAVIRETEEEIGLVPLDPVKRGELRFQFADGLSIFCHVFTGHTWRGDLRPSEEARPFWSRIDAVPYHRMWADDRHWLPFVLEHGKNIDGRFGFDGDRMTWKNVKLD